MTAVSCHPLYSQPFDVHPPASPKHWSYSALRTWRDCPRRWWLENSRHGNDAHRYPRRIHPGVVEGILVHRLIERFARFLRERSTAGASGYDESRRAFPIRRELLHELDEVCAKEFAGNPRVDTQQIRARVDVDACLNGFRQATRLLRQGFDESWWPSNGHPGGGATRSRGVEKWLESELPRIGGQVDLITESALGDYKTGAPSDEHWEQLRFYALLYWLTFKRAIGTLRLVYTANGDELEMEAPSAADLDQAAHALIAETEAIDKRLSTAEQPPARPAPDRCRTCHVRQLCDDYWDKDISRGNVQTLQESADSMSWWEDVEVRFAVPVTLGSEYSGPANTVSWGAVRVRIGPGKTAAGELVNGARLLGARCERNHSGFEITAARDTEVFWLPSARQLN